MNKLPIFTPPTQDPRLGLDGRPSLPMERATMHEHSRNLAASPALRSVVARDPHAGLDWLAADSPWVGRMKAVQLPGFVATAERDPRVNVAAVNAAANVNAAVNVNAVTKVNVAAVANAAVVNSVLLVNRNWVFGVEATSAEAWRHTDAAMLECI